MDPPAKAGKALLCPEQMPRGDQAKAKDDFRSYESDLFPEIGNALVDFFAERCAVIRGPTLEDIADVDLVAPEVDRFKDLVQELTGPTNKRLTLLVFISPGCFSDQKERSVRIADAKNEFRSRMPKRTFQTLADHSVQLMKCCRGPPRLGARADGAEQLRFFRTDSGLSLYRSLLDAARFLRDNRIAEHRLFVVKELLDVVQDLSS